MLNEAADRNHRLRFLRLFALLRAGPVHLVRDRLFLRDEVVSGSDRQFGVSVEVDFHLHLLTAFAVRDHFDEGHTDAVFMGDLREQAPCLLTFDPPQNRLHLGVGQFLVHVRQSADGKILKTSVRVIAIERTNDDAAGQLSAERFPNQPSG